MLSRWTAWVRTEASSSEPAPPLFVGEHTIERRAFSAYAEHTIKFRRACDLTLATVCVPVRQCTDYSSGLWPRAVSERCVLRGACCSEVAIPLHEAAATEERERQGQVTSKQVDKRASKIASTSTLACIQEPTPPRGINSESTYQISKPMFRSIERGQRRAIKSRGLSTCSSGAYVPRLACVPLGRVLKRRGVVVRVVSGSSTAEQGL